MVLVWTSVTVTVATLSWQIPLLEPDALGEVAEVIGVLGERVGFGLEERPELKAWTTEIGLDEVLDEEVER
jgi:hypothetical protein